MFKEQQMKITIKNVDLNKAGFTLIDIGHQAVAIRGNGVQTLGCRGDDQTVELDAPHFLIAAFVAELEALKVPFAVLEA